MAALETINLKKRYGRIEALRGVSLHVDPGEIYGLLGQNGAGKTTLIKTALGINRQFEGEVLLLGKPAGTAEIRSRVGYLPEDHNFPDYHTGRSLLDFYGQLLGVSRSERNKRIPPLLDELGILDRMNYKIRGYSKGMKQRLGIAQALMHDPEIIFLDEPTDGVDPVGRREIRAMMQRLKERGRTIFLNSHLLGEVELICDRVGILAKGQMIREGDVTSLTRQKGKVLIGLAPGQQLPMDDLRQMGFDVVPYNDRWEFQLSEQQSIDPVVDFLRSRNLSLRHLVEKRQSLEDLFVETVERDGRGSSNERREPREDRRPPRGRPDKARDDQFRTRDPR